MSNPGSTGPRSRSNRSKYLIVYAGELATVRFNPTEPGQPEDLLGKLDPPAADDVLRALRSTFTITYDSSMTKTSASQIGDIRLLLTRALLPLSDVLRTLKLKPIGGDGSLKADEEMSIHKFVLVPDRALRLTVQHDSGKDLLIGLMESQVADGVLIAARSILSMTFEEVFTRLEHLRLLGRIRKEAAEALVPCNWCLEAIEVEPVALPSVLGFEFLEQDLAEEKDAPQA